MIIDTTQTKVERQTLTNQQKEEIIAQLLLSEKGRQQLIAAMEPRRCPKISGTDAAQYICKT